MAWPGVGDVRVDRLSSQEGFSLHDRSKISRCVGLIRHEANTDARLLGASEVPVATLREKASLRCKEGIVWFDSLTTS